MAHPYFSDFLEEVFVISFLVQPDCGRSTGAGKALGVRYHGSDLRRSGGVGAIAFGDRTHHPSGGDRKIGIERIQCVNMSPTL